MSLCRRQHNTYEDALAGDVYVQATYSDKAISRYPSIAFIEDGPLRLTAKDITKMNKKNRNRLWMVDRALNEYPEKEVESNSFRRVAVSAVISGVLIGVLGTGLANYVLGPNEVRETPQSSHILHTRGTADNPSILLVNNKNEASILDCTFTTAREQSSPAAVCTMVSPDEALTIRDEELAYHKVPFDKIRSYYQEFCDPAFTEEYNLRNPACNNNLGNIIVEHPSEITLSKASRVFQGDEGASRVVNFSTPQRKKPLKYPALSKTVSDLENVTNAYDPHSLKAPKTSHTLVDGMAFSSYVSSFSDILPLIGAGGLVYLFTSFASRRTKNKAQEKVDNFKKEIGLDVVLNNES